MVATAMVATACRLLLPLWAMVATATVATATAATATVPLIMHLWETCIVLTLIMGLEVSLQATVATATVVTVMVATVSAPCLATVSAPCLATVATVATVSALRLSAVTKIPSSVWAITAELLVVKPPLLTALKALLASKFLPVPPTWVSTLGLLIKLDSYLSMKYILYLVSRRSSTEHEERFLECFDVSRTQ